MAAIEENSKCFYYHAVSLTYVEIANPFRGMIVWLLSHFIHVGLQMGSFLNYSTFFPLWYLTFKKHTAGVKLVDLLV